MKLSRGPAVLLSFAAAALVFWSPALRPGRALFHDLLLRLFHPYFVFTGESLRSGRIPFWNPHLYGGVPFLANGQSALFYPSTWLSLLGGFGACLTLDVVLHATLAACLAFAWAKTEGLSSRGAAAAGILYAFNGFFVLHYAAPGQMHALAWMPAVLHGARRLALGKDAKGWLLAGAGIAFQAFAGHPQFVIYTAAAALALAMPSGRGAVMRTACALGAGLLLSSVQWIPALPVLLDTPRAAGLGTEWATTYSLSPREGLLMLGVPLWNRFFTPASGDPHIVGFYVGLPALFLAGLGLWKGKKPWAPFALLAAAGLVLSLGGHLPFYGLAVEHLWPLRVFRFPAQALCLAAAGLSLLAGAGLDRMGKRAGACLLVLVFADLWAFGAKGARTIDAGVYEGEPRTAAVLKSSRPARVMAAPKTRSRRDWQGRSEADAWGHFKEALIPNVGMAWGLSDADGYEEVRSRDYERVLAEMGRSPGSPWLDWMGVRYILSVGPIPGGALRPLPPPAAGIYENGNAAPRVYAAPEALSMTREEAFAAISTATVRPMARVLVEGPLDPGEGKGAPAEVLWTEKGPNQLLAQVSAAGPVWLVVTDAWAPGWKASVNGRPLPVRRANFIQRAVRLPGSSQVLFSYSPPLWGWGILGSVLGLSLLGWGWRRMI